MSWITHRAPTRDDADADGDVVYRSGESGGSYAYMNWSDFRDTLPIGTPFISWVDQSPPYAPSEASDEKGCPSQDPGEVQQGGQLNLFLTGDWDLHISSRGQQ